ncbi:MAG TPA: oligopeptidase B, partial [Nocardioidaceae bacterium]|nr:oligopeptidase B [Nocardioidaceae bacterium]
MNAGQRTTPTTPPTPRRDRVLRSDHGVDRVDDFAWLRDTSSPEVLAHLAAERAWYDAATSHGRSLVETLTAEMSSRVPPADRSVSWRRVQFSYYTFTPTGREYPQLMRVRHHSDGLAATESVAESAHPDGLPTPEVLFDAAHYADGSGYVDVGVQQVSPDERWLAYSLDTTGEEVFRLAFRDLARGLDLDEVIPRTYYSGAWSADSSTFFYTVHDDAYRPYQVWRHRLGSAVQDDVCVLDEPDARFELTVRHTRSGDLVVATARSRETTEVWLVDAHSPTQEATCVEPRRRGVEYDVEHARLASGRDVLLLLTNDGATEFRLMEAPLATPGREHWHERIAENP